MLHRLNRDEAVGCNSLMQMQGDSAVRGRSHAQTAIPQVVEEVVVKRSELCHVAFPPPISPQQNPYRCDRRLRTSVAAISGTLVLFAPRRQSQVVPRQKRSSSRNVCQTSCQPCSRTITAIVNPAASGSGGGGAGNRPAGLPQSLKDWPRLA